MILEFEDFEFRGYKCTVVHNCFDNGVGNGSWWTGYVMLPRNNKFHGKSCEEISLDCHGGLTFSDTHNIANSRYRGRFAMGFDFMHYGDNGGSKIDSKIECKILVHQLKKLENKN